jgi:hypothetical protein
VGRSLGVARLVILSSRSASETEVRRALWAKAAISRAVVSTRLSKSEADRDLSHPSPGVDAATAESGRGSLSVNLSLLREKRGRR